jgi:hypothetical protein
VSNSRAASGVVDSYGTMSSIRGGSNEEAIILKGSSVFLVGNV